MGGVGVLQGPVETEVLGFIFDRYLREVAPTKARATRYQIKSCMTTLRKVFGDVNIHTVTPQQLAQYRDKRARTAPVLANRELSVFSSVWTMAREWGYTNKENQVKGIRKIKEKPRDFYADAAVWNAVYAKACEELKDAMDLAYLTGQRPADVLNMRFTDIRDGSLEVQQNKTKRSCESFWRVTVDAQN